MQGVIKQGVRVLSFFCLGMVALPTVGSLAQEIQATRRIDLAELKHLPESLGYLTETHLQSAPLAPAAAKQLILIQDIHADPQAQQALSGILDYLVTRYGTQLIFVEGGMGDVGLAFMREAVSRETREHVAQEFLAQGLISGEEHLDIVSDHALTLWGIEDEALYVKHFKVFLEVEQIRAQVQGDLAALKQLTEVCIEQTFNPALLDLHRKQVQYREQALAFEDYSRYLLDLAQAQALPLDGYPQLARLHHSSAVHAALDYAAIPHEQQQAVAALYKQASVEQQRALKALVDQTKAGTLDAAAFNQQLFGMLTDAGIGLEAYPHLVRYAQQHALQSDFDVAAVLSELRALESALVQQLAAAPAEQHLVQVARALDGYDRLVQLHWVPADYREYIESNREAALTHLLSDLQAQAARLNLTPWSGDAAALEAKLRGAVEFYRLAIERDTAILQQVLDKMDAEQAHTAVLIIGGFHANHLIQLFKEEAFELAVIVPAAGSGEDDGRYAEILKKKNSFLLDASGFHGFAHQEEYP